jgi:hypothetical protein
MYTAEQLLWEKKIEREGKDLDERKEEGKEEEIRGGCVEEKEKNVCDVDLVSGDCSGNGSVCLEGQ